MQHEISIIGNQGISTTLRQLGYDYPTRTHLETIKIQLSIDELWIKLFNSPNALPYLVKKSLLTAKLILIPIYIEADIKRYYNVDVQLSAIKNRISLIDTTGLEFNVAYIFISNKSTQEARQRQQHIKDTLALNGKNNIHITLNDQNSVKRFLPFCLKSCNDFPHPLRIFDAGLFYNNLAITESVAHISRTLSQETQSFIKSDDLEVLIGTQPNNSFKMLYRDTALDLDISLVPNYNMKVCVFCLPVPRWPAEVEELVNFFRQWFEANQQKKIKIDLLILVGFYDENIWRFPLLLTKLQSIVDNYIGICLKPKELPYHLKLLYVATRFPSGLPREIVEQRKQEVFRGRLPSLQNLALNTIPILSIQQLLKSYSGLVYEFMFETLFLTPHVYLSEDIRHNVPRSVLESRAYTESSISNTIGFHTCILPCNTHFSNPLESWADTLNPRFKLVESSSPNLAAAYGTTFHSDKDTDHNAYIFDAAQASFLNNIDKQVHGFTLAIADGAGYPTEPEMAAALHKHTEKAVSIVCSALVYPQYQSPISLHSKLQQFAVIEDVKCCFDAITGQSEWAETCTLAAL